MDPLISPALSAIHGLLATPSTAGGASSRMAEFTACARRVMARARAEIDVVPGLQAERQDAWRALAERATGSAAPATSMPAQAEHIRAALAAGSAAPGGPVGQAWFADAVAAVGDYVEALETALPSAPTAALDNGGDPDRTRTELAAYLRARFPALPADPITAFEAIPGGRAKETSRFTVAPGAGLPSRLILRRDFARDTTGTKASAEYPLLKAVHAAGIPVPRPILAEDDPTVLGGSFVIVEEVLGAKGMGELFPELNDFSRIDAGFGAALADAVARLHALHALHDPSLVAAMQGHHTGAKPHDAVRSFHQMWSGLPKPPFALATEMGFAWLLATPLPEGRPVGLVHGDLGAHNLMVRDGELAAVLDWELAHLGDPAEDIGYMRATLIDPLTGWDRFVTDYVAAGGRPQACDRRAVDWFSTWAHVRNSVYVALFRSWVTAGERSDIESLNAAWDFFARTQRYIARELGRALAG